MHPRIRGLTTLFALLLMCSVTACASSGGSSSSERRDPDVISRTELAELDAQSAYEAVRRLRPRWLRARGGGSPAVFRDGSPITDDVSGLRRFQIRNIEEIRYLNSSSATMRYGSGYQDGAIEIITRG